MAICRHRFGPTNSEQETTDHAPPEATCRTKLCLMSDKISSSQKGCRLICAQFWSSLGSTHPHHLMAIVRYRIAYRLKQKFRSGLDGRGHRLTSGGLEQNNKMEKYRRHTVTLRRFETRPTTLDNDALSEEVEANPSDNRVLPSSNKIRPGSRQSILKCHQNKRVFQPLLRPFAPPIADAIRSVMKLRHESAAEIHRQLVETYVTELMSRQYAYNQKGPPTSDFHLFTKLKEFAGGKRFCNSKWVKDTVEKWLSEVERKVFDEDW
ncbi:hypothetical protein AAG570_010068 [Ranatra chinensis]|uniref:Uncharacterized protein n=1 Tax=Ranatra chinensis TaxID=642074 RepID=A0ABD0YLG6_9HEMI